MSSKTKAGVYIQARQRVHRKKASPVKAFHVTASPTGHLIVGTMIGEQRGLTVTMAVSLEEVLAWLPKMIENAQENAARKAVRAATP